MRISNFIVILVVTILTIVFIFDHYVVGSPVAPTSAATQLDIESEPLMEVKIS